MVGFRSLLRTPPPAQLPGDSALRSRLEIKFTLMPSLPSCSGTLMRQDRVIPLAVEIGSLKPNGLHLDRAHLDTNRILPRIERRLDAQPGGRAGTANEADDHLATQQRLSTPVRGDVAKHTMLDLVPFARARRQMAYCDT